MHCKWFKNVHLQLEGKGQKAEASFSEDIWQLVKHVSASSIVPYAQLCCGEFKKIWLD